MIFYGRNVVYEALRSSHPIKGLMVDSSLRNDQNQKIIEILHKAGEKNIPVSYIPRKQLEKNSGSDDTQGIAVDLVLSQFNLKKDLKNHSSERKRRYMYISTSTFEHNVGAIIRTAESAGMSGVIVPRDLDLSSIVAKTSAGAIFNIKIYKESIYNTIKLFKLENIEIYGIERGGELYTSKDLNKDSLFIIGGEDKSLSGNLIGKIDGVLSIPQFGKVNSLNMSVAAAVVMFEQVRQIS